MELYHHLIDTDSLGARIHALTQGIIPRNSPEQLREDIDQAVDEAVEPILKTDLKELMDRVERTARKTVDARLQRWATTAPTVNKGPPQEQQAPPAR